MFHRGIFSVADDLLFIGLDGHLRVAKSYLVEAKFQVYHREHYDFPDPIGL